MDVLNVVLELLGCWLFVAYFGKKSLDKNAFLVLRKTADALSPRSYMFYVICVNVLY
jgi:hypothetical protein